MTQLDMLPDVRSRPEDDPDSRYTPRELITQLHREHRFTVDVASALDAPSSHVIGRFWSRLEDGLTQPWRGERVWCNPPYSEIGRWVSKAWREMTEGGCRAVVMLLPANRTDMDWWQEMIEPYRDLPRIGEAQFRTRFLPGRTRFGFPGNPDGVGQGSPMFGCVLLIWETQP